MFTGIIEATGKVVSVEQRESNVIFTIESPISAELKVDQSVSHSGVCLTVTHVAGQQHQVTAIAETLDKTNLGSWQPGQQVNLERCVPLNGRLDGHLVQGHVDSTAECIEKTDQGGSWLYRFRYPARYDHLLIEKGSICLNGISLTVFDLRDHSFAVAIIPYTYEHTNLQQIAPGMAVNLEFDMVGKYLARWRQLGV